MLGGDQAPMIVATKVLVVAAGLLVTYVIGVAVLAGVGRRSGRGQFERLARLLAIGPVASLVGLAGPVGPADSASASASVVLSTPARTSVPVVRPTASRPSVAVATIGIADADHGRGDELITADGNAPIADGRERGDLWEVEPGDLWEVAPGEHFWSIAEAVVTLRLSRSPTDREIDSFWRELVAANRDRLIDRDNPDLLRPGQVLFVPRGSG